MRVKNILITNYAHESNFKKGSKLSCLFDDFSISPKEKKIKLKILDQSNWSKTKFSRSNNINKLYHKFMSNLSSVLNQYHKVNFSIKFWETILGPWLMTFLDNYLELYYGIKQILNKQKFLYGAISINKKRFIPLDNKEFIKFFKSHNWHNFLTQLVLNDNFKNQVNYSKIKKLKFNDKMNVLRMQETNHFLSKLNLFILKFSNTIVLNLPSSFLFKVKLLFKIKQFGIPIFEEHIKVKKILRDRFIKKNQKIGNNLENKIFNRLLENLPTMALENFSYFVNTIKKKYKKINPKKILLTTGHVGITELLFFVAIKKEEGSKLIIYQHGGRYNMLRNNWFELHEKRISDEFIYWGKGYKSNHKFYGYPKKKFNRGAKRSNLLIAFTPRSIFSLFTFSKNSKIKKSFFTNFISHFYQSLNQDIKKNNILIRFKNKDVEDYKDTFFDYVNKSKIKIDKNLNFNDALTNIRLVVTNTTSTIALETIASNIPTLLIQDIDKKEFKKETKLVLKRLKKNNVYFEDFAKAKNFINNNWNKIDKWWFSNKTQSAIKEYAKNYCHYDKNYSSRLIKYLAK